MIVTALAGAGLYCLAIRVTEGTAIATRIRIGRPVKAAVGELSLGLAALRREPEADTTLP